MAAKKKKKAAPPKATANKKKTAPKKSAKAKSSTKKAAPKKAAPKKAATKKAATKKAAPKKAATKKAAPKKAAPKKAAPKKAAPKTAATKTAAPKKAAPQEAGVVEAKAEAQAVVAAEEAKPVAAEKKEKKPLDPSEELAQAIAALALDKKAEDVVILKVTDLTSYADCFILASAPSERQVQAIARNVDDEMRKAGKAPVGTEGLEQGHWVLVDLGAAVLHVFLSSARQYYDLEGFWTDAPRVDVDEQYGLKVLERMRAAREAARAEAEHAAAANE